MTCTFSQVHRQKLPLFGSDVSHHAEVEVGQVALGGTEQVSPVGIRVEKAFEIDTGHPAHTEQGIEKTKQKGNEGKAKEARFS